MDKSKIRVDQDICIGCGSCVAVAPNTFGLDDESKKAVLTSGENCDEEGTVKDAADCCPVNCIYLG